jgi:hypothetical protein
LFDAKILTENVAWIAGIAEAWSSAIVAAINTKLASSACYGGIVIDWTNINTMESKIITKATAI